MPRVNRDLQRRLAARRERERRRPSTERRYQFTSPNTAVEPVEDAIDSSTLADESVEAAAAAATPVARGANARAAAAAQPAAAAARATTRGPRPYSEYGAEYAYVRSDLRRIAFVVGSILVIVLVLYFVLPH